MGMAYTHHAIAILFALAVGGIGIAGFAKRGNVGWLLIATYALLRLVTAVAEMAVMMHSATSMARRSTVYSAMGVVGWGGMALLVTGLAFLLSENNSKKAT
jgi:hypothetical protein